MKNKSTLGKGEYHSPEMAVVRITTDVITASAFVEGTGLGSYNMGWWKE